MKNVLMLYDSNTGNTEKMAKHVHEGVQSFVDIDARLRAVRDATAEDVIWCDGIAVGAPTNMGLLSWRMKRFWDEEMRKHWGEIDGKIGCAFSSSGGWGGGAEIACMSILTVLMNFGFLVFGVTNYVDEQFTLHYGAINAGEPRSEQAKKSCIKLGTTLANHVLHNSKQDYQE